MASCQAPWVWAGQLNTKIESQASRPDLGNARFSVGASSLAMDVNDGAGQLMPRGVHRLIASKLGSCRGMGASSEFRVAGHHGITHNDPGKTAAISPG